MIKSIVNHCDKLFYAFKNAMIYGRWCEISLCTLRMRLSLCWEGSVLTQPCLYYGSSAPDWSTNLAGRQYVLTSSVSQNLQQSSWSAAHTHSLFGKYVLSHAKVSPLLNWQLRYRKQKLNIEKKNSWLLQSICPRNIYRTSSEGQTLGSGPANKSTERRPKAGLFLWDLDQVEQTDTK